jgi:hypothetical protein
LWEIAGCHHYFISKGSRMTHRRLENSCGYYIATFDFHHETYKQSTCMLSKLRRYIGGMSVYPKSHGDGGWDLGDEFPTTWADDGFQYSGAGDNSGGPA